MESLALTDYRSLTGAVRFYDACLEAGIKPILGLEIRLKHELGAGDLVLLGMDMQGWANLCRLSSWIQTSPESSSGLGINMGQLSEASQGLICLSGGKRGLLNYLAAYGQEKEAQTFLGQLSEIFAQRLYVELQSPHPSDARIIEHLRNLAFRVNIPLMASNSVYYRTPEESRLQRTLSAMRLNTTLTTLPPEAPAPDGSYFTSTKEMIRRFRDLPDAVDHTKEIAGRCNLILPVGIPHYPHIQLPPGETAINRLQHLAEKGAVKKYTIISQTIKERLDHELKIIQEQGYAPLFLIVQDILEFARKNEVPASSRGSAASSLVAFCLGITTPDPIALELYFERFLNPARSSPPDIDTDLCSKRREKVIQYVYGRYGSDRVAMVATVNCFQKRSALREVAKAYGFSRDDISLLTDSLPSRGWGPPGRRQNRTDDPYHDIKDVVSAKKYQAVFKDAAAILGFPRHLSVHPGGIVIAPGPLTDLVPLHLAAKGIVTTQFDLDSIERMGLIKIDLLGTRGLTVLGDVAEKICTWRSTEFRSMLDVIDSIPEDDPETRALVRSTNTIGCFAIESPGMRATLREINASKPEDIMIALALYRPGPMTGGLKDSFVRRHLGQESVEHLHPSLAALLENTYGVILYQEQVLRIASEMAGLSLADADLLRRAMSQFDPGDQMKTLKARFTAGALKKSGVPQETAEQIWELMAAFAGYGFPKAHAASYAQVAWRSIWCKAHYPAEFMAAVLAGWGGYYRQHVYISEARSLGLTVRAPHINHSFRQFTATYPQGVPTLYMGLDQIRDLTRTTQNRIITRRPFNSLTEFLSSVDPRPKEVANLIKIGGLRGFGPIPELLDRTNTKGWRLSQPWLFELTTEEKSLEEDWEIGRRVKAQTEILGIGLDAHPVELNKEQIVMLNALSVDQAAKKMDVDVRVAGIRQTIQRFHTTTGNPYYILELDDPTGVLPVRLSDRFYQRNREKFSRITPFCVEGTMVKDPLSEGVFLEARKLIPLSSKF